MKEGEPTKEPLSLEEARDKFNEIIYFHKGKPDDLKSFFESNELLDEFFEDPKILDRVASQVGSLEHEIIPELESKEDDEHQKLLADYREWIKILQEKFPKAGSKYPENFRDREDELLDESRSL